MKLTHYKCMKLTHYKCDDCGKYKNLKLGYKIVKTTHTAFDRDSADRYSCNHFHIRLCLECYNDANKRNAKKTKDKKEK